MKRKIKVDESNVHKAKQPQRLGGEDHESAMDDGQGLWDSLRYSPCKSHVGQTDVAVKRTAR